jgi:hypothetical protein
MALNGPSPQPRRLIERPTANMLPKGNVDLDLRVFTEGGILGGIGIGLMDRFTLGFSFGGTQIIGSKEIDWNPRVEFAGKYLLFEEARSLPAIVVGFESQGYGAYNDSLKSYATKSAGFFVSATRSYQTFLGAVGLHGGINLSLENDDGDRDPSGYIGVDKSLNDQISILAEYNLRTNQNGSRSFTLDDGHLNVAIRWTFNRQLDLELDMKNLLRDEVAREIRIILLESL